MNSKMLVSCFTALASLGMAQNAHATYCGSPVPAADRVYSSVAGICTDVLSGKSVSISFLPICPIAKSSLPRSVAGNVFVSLEIDGLPYIVKTLTSAPMKSPADLEEQVSVAASSPNLYSDRDGNFARTGQPTYNLYSRYSSFAPSLLIWGPGSRSDFTDPVLVSYKGQFEFIATPFGAHGINYPRSFALDLQNCVGVR